MKYSQPTNSSTNYRFPPKKGVVLQGKFHFQPSIFRGYVNFQGGYSRFLQPTFEMQVGNLTLDQAAYSIMAQAGGWSQEVRWDHSNRKFHSSPLKKTWFSRRGPFLFWDFKHFIHEIHEIYIYIISNGNTTVSGGELLNFQGVKPGFVREFSLKSGSS